MKRVTEDRGALHGERSGYLDDPQLTNRRRGNRRFFKGNLFFTAQTLALIRQFQKSRVFRRATFLSMAVVVFVTTYALILPAITLEQNVASKMPGIGAVHAKLLECQVPVHYHTKECYREVDGEEKLICGKADYVLHHHDANCYDEDGNLICELPEITAGDEGVAEPHTHVLSCYEYGPNGENALQMGWITMNPDGSLSGGVEHLTCGELEVKEHQHVEECFREQAVEESADEETVKEESAEAEEEVGTEDATKDKSLNTVPVDESADEEVQTSEGRNAVDDIDNEIEDNDDNINGESSIVDAGKTAFQDSFDQIWEGDDCWIHVTAGEEAGIPADAELQVQEITQDTMEYLVYHALAKETLNGGDTSVITNRFFDISFLVKGENGEVQSIEPNAAVKVDINFIEAQQIEGDNNLNIVHFKDDGQNVEVLESEPTMNDRGMASISFESDSFSVYGVMYTVDFHWEVDGKTFDFSMPGGGFVSLSDLVKVLGILDGQSSDENGTKDEIADNVSGDFVANVKNVEFSDPSLLSVYKVEEDSNVGEIKQHLGLVCDYSSELTQDQIDDINAQPLNEGDWVLISHAPFDSQETLTVTLKTGEVFRIQVTDAVIQKEEIDPSTGYVLYYQEGNTYYVLKTDGTTETVSSTEEMDALSNEYQWTLTYVYVEDGIERYNIRPFTDRTISLALNHPGQSLIGNGPNNITVVPTDDGASPYILGGYNNTKLKLQDGAFAGVDDGTSTPIQIYGLEPLHKYTFTVQTNNSSMGKVSGRDSSGTSQTNKERFTTVTNTVQNTSDAKTNKYEITAVPDNTITGTDGRSKYILDHWEFNGKILYQGPNNTIITEYSGAEPAKYTNTTIPSGKLTIPENAGTLMAVFKEDPNYKAKDEDKQGTEFKDMDSWMNSLIRTNTPISDAGTNKTAEVYDYENRIYRVDLTAQSNLSTINGNLDLGFVLDVSGSMKFPSKLVEDTEQGVRNVWQINEASESHQDYNYWEGWHTVVDRYYWEDWGLVPGNYYYVIAESDTRSTVFRLFYDYSTRKWKRVDASYEDSSGSAAAIDSNTKFGVDTSSNTSGYQIYLDGDYPNKRMDYEQSSLTNTISSLKELITALTLVQETGQNPNAKNPDSRIAWNTFCANLPKWHRNFTSVTSNETIISNGDYAYAGGTRTDYALGTEDEGINNGNTQVSKHQYGAYNFDWDTSNESNYVILITDGAPQYGQGQKGPSTASGKQQLKENTDHLVYEVKDNVDALREDKNVKMITVGLSMDDVEQGRKMLYDIADTVNGERMFYSAESGDQLEDILLHIIDTIMVDATVVGNVTDTIGEAFYPVDLATGRILSDNDEIDLNGNCVTNDNSYSGPRGKIIKDGDIYKVEWTGQDIPKTGWHGTVYVKAREDFMGGNAVVTNNDLEGKATVTATDYKLPGSNTKYKLADTAYILDDNGQKVENTNYKLTKEMSTPRVNVNELRITENNSEWTVYLGTEVDPKEQIEQLYNNILVEEAVKKGGAKDTNDDNLPDILIPGGDQNQYNYTKEESISDQRPALGDPETFYFKDMIKTLVNPGGSSEWWDYSEETLKWDELIRMANLENQDDNTGFTIKYNKYGLRDDGYFNIKLTKVVADGETGIEESPHATTVIGDDVEKYTLTVLFVPDYKTPPEGQGGTPEHAKEYKTGGFGTAYQGHAAGKETKTNTHEINVYAKPLDVLKLDNRNQTLPGATFALYRIAKDGETSVESNLTQYDESLTGEYVKISEGTSDSSGVVHLANTGTTGRTRLEAGETYYLIETGVPEGYERETAYKVVTVEADENGTFTDLKGNSLEDKLYPFNWDQGVRIKVDDSVVPLDANGAEVSMAGKSYLQDDEVAVFRTKVINSLKTIEIEVGKQWKDANDNPLEDHPDEIGFKLYRVSYKACNHEWTVTPATCEENGSRVCSVCGETEEIPATGHAWGEWTIEREAHYNQPGLKQRVCANDPSHVEEQEYTIEGHDHVYGDWVVTTPATCEGEGVQTRYCNICLEPYPETQTIPALGHDYKLTDMTPATCTEDGSRTYTCTHDSSHHYTETIPATGHDYGEWVVTTPATTSAPGVETRYCANDPSHTETREIPKLDDATTVTFNVNKRINGEYYEYDYKSITATYPVGTRLRIEWTYPNGYYHPNAWFKANASRVYFPNYGDHGCYFVLGQRLPYVEMTQNEANNVTNYSFEVDVSENLVIDICLENEWNIALPTPTITVVNAASQSSNSTNRLFMAKRNAVLRSSPDVPETSEQSSEKDAQAETSGNDIAAVLKGGTRESATVLTAEQLQALLAQYKTPEQAQGQYNVSVIEEVSPEYTITSNDNWKKTIDNLPRRDEDGNEYTYYVVETSPATGYLITYDGESSGLQDGGKVTIINKRVEVTIEILKKDHETKEPLPGAKFTLTQVDSNGNAITGGVVRGETETDDQGKITFTKIVSGRYKLEETDPPAGYVKTEGPYYINVSANGTNDYVEGTVIYASVDGHIFTIENVPGAALPNTGGPGTKLFTILGSILILGAGVLLWKRRRTI